MRYENIDNLEIAADNATASPDTFSTDVQFQATVIRLLQVCVRLLSYIARKV